MKKYFAAVLISMIGLIAIVEVANAAYACGPNKHLWMKPEVGTLWTKGTLSNYGEEIKKQVYAKAGRTGSYGEWAEAKTYSTSHTDYRTALEPDDAMVGACWIYNGVYDCNF